ncbi:hypothetical protein BaRGS_00014248 [Batillaria attramentaria]|uniref:Uncharacterized protein n=1 Tax=Batillaria attramentaria TaxID=370345 RepID=A0ABD0L5G7_9CAEN
MFSFSQQRQHAGYACLTNNCPPYQPLSVNKIPREYNPSTTLTDLRQSPGIQRQGKADTGSTPSQTLNTTLCMTMRPGGQKGPCEQHCVGQTESCVSAGEAGQNGRWVDSAGGDREECDG